MSLETRAVLAAAYGRFNRGSMLTHAVEVIGDRDARVLCKRVDLDHLADRYALAADKRTQAPTCKSCSAQWRKAGKP